MESKDRKRSIDQEDENGSKKPRAPPAYGSQEYWEERYQNLKESKTDDAEPDPFHAWYFNYEELAPLLLPLILGEGNEEETAKPNCEDVDESDPLGPSGDTGEEKEDREEKTNADDKGENLAKTDETDPKNDKDNDDIENTKDTNDEASVEEADDDPDEAEDDDDEEEDDEFEEMDGSDEDEQDAPTRIGLAKEGPISILEVGCGDVPLGRDIAKGIQELESVAGVEVANILKQVVCTDYSKAVIEAMKEEQESKANQWKLSAPLKYEFADARKMSYKDESFELVIEKGTLDAMLSDAEMGPENCKLIVGECARVLTTGGYFVIVSHLNAHAPKGLEWLDDIVVPGLRKGDGRCTWQIEVHGNDADVPSDREESDDNSIEASHGPAVYVIRKCPGPSTAVDKDGTDPAPPGSSLDLRFFSY